MPTDFPDQVQWERVNAELQAAREASSVPGAISTMRPWVAICPTSVQLEQARLKPPAARR